MSDESHFRHFAQDLETAIHTFEIPDNFLEKQKEQVELLVELEQKLKEKIIDSDIGEAVYEAFITYITVVKGNILAARPFFRERQETFTKYISKALKVGDIKTLQKFNFNFHMVQFILGSFTWTASSRVVQLARKIASVRNEIVVTNLPLAISRARIFFSRTPKSQLDFMDFVQISCEGLMSAIDKFVLPYSKAFRSVAIGRMHGNFIEQYSETLIHFYPVDRRKLYRANKLLGRNSDITSIENLSSKVNEGVDKPGLTNPDELANLIAAQSHVSTEQAIVMHDTKENGTVKISDHFAAPQDQQPDVLMEQADSMHNLGEAISKLTILEQKILKLKGVTF